MARGLSLQPRRERGQRRRPLHGLSDAGPNSRAPRVLAAPWTKSPRPHRTRIIRDHSSSSDTLRLVQTGRRRSHYTGQASPPLQGAFRYFRAIQSAQTAIFLQWVAPPSWTNLNRNRSFKSSYPASTNGRRSQASSTACARKRSKIWRSLSLMTAHVTGPGSF